MSARASENERAAVRPLRVLHFTDTHLFADPGRTLLGVNTSNSLRRVLQLSKESDGPFGLALATGDLVHDASATGYKRLVDEVGKLGVPVFCLPGNHDERIAMSRYLDKGNVVWQRRVDTGAWQILMLDSIIPGEDGGRLEDRELEFLNDALTNDTRPTLVCLHHHPQPVNSEWIDTMVLENADRFFEVLDRHEQVRGVLFGHIHQDYEAQRNGVRLMASPSTCVQFSPMSTDFKVDQIAPGYRILDLLPNGEILSKVVRCTQIPAGLDVASGGY